MDVPRDGCSTGWMLDGMDERVFDCEGDGLKRKMVEIR